MLHGLQPNRHTKNLGPTTANLSGKERERAILQLAKQQHGLISLNQLAELGASRSLAARRVASGHWQRSAPSVFRIGAMPISMEQRLMAATLTLAPNALVSHRAAAWLWGLRRTRRTPIELSVPREIRLKRPGHIIHRVRDLHLASPTTIQGIPVTGLIRTILDVAAVEPEQTERLIMQARREHGQCWEDLRDELKRHLTQGRTGTASVQAVLARHYGDLASDSATEDEAYLLMLRSKRLPRPVKQAPIRCADGVVVRADFAWPKYRAVLEIQGVDHFVNERLQHIDLHRRNQIELAGYRFLAYSGRMIRRDPKKFLADVEGLLALCGWHPN